jgi:hypothetical protein
MVTLNPSKDNTIFVDAAGAQSDGAGPYLRAGRSGEVGATINLRRGLIEFDIAGNVPVGATITSVTLTLFRSNVGSLFNNENITLQRVTADWGEANSISIGGTGDGAGGIATPGDATWTQRFFGAAPPQPWSASGGDFVADISTNRTVPRSPAGTVAFTWPSTPQFVSDVQSFLDAPDANFGWIIRGDEVTTRSAVRFASRNHTNPAQWPALTITFTPPTPSRLVGDIDNDRDVDGADIAKLVLHYGTTGTGDSPFDVGDFDGDNTVSLIDLALAQQHLGEKLPGENVGVPEPQTWATATIGIAIALTVRAAGRRRRTEHIPSVAA